MQAIKSYPLPKAWKWGDGGSWSCLHLFGWNRYRPFQWSVPPLLTMNPTNFWKACGGLWNKEGHEPLVCKPQTSPFHQLWQGSCPSLVRLSRIAAQLSAAESPLPLDQSPVWSHILYPPIKPSSMRSLFISEPYLAMIAVRTGLLHNQPLQWGQWKLSQVSSLYPAFHHVCTSRRLCA